MLAVDEHSLLNDCSPSTMSTIQNSLNAVIQDEVVRLLNGLSNLQLGPIGQTVSLPAQQSYPIENMVPAYTHVCSQNHYDKPMPKDYMCHLCFSKDHFIRDCPLVRPFPWYIEPNMWILSIYNTISIVFINRLWRRTRAIHRIKAKNAVSANTNARNVSASGCPAILGQTWLKIASSAKSRFIRTNRYLNINIAIYEQLHFIIFLLCLIPAAIGQNRQFGCILSIEIASTAPLRKVPRPRFLLPKQLIPRTDPAIYISFSNKFSNTQMLKVQKYRWTISWTFWTQYFSEEKAEEKRHCSCKTSLSRNFRNIILVEADVCELCAILASC